VVRIILEALFIVHVGDSAGTTELHVLPPSILLCTHEITYLQSYKH